MKIRSLLLFLILSFAGKGYCAGPDQSLSAFLEQHCYECHDDTSAKGDLNLLDATFDLAAPANFRLWEQVHNRVEKGEMPPDKKPRPEEAQRAEFLQSMSGQLASAELEIRRENGRAEIRRLSRSEYEHTLQDLLALPHLDIAEALPPEGSAHGFDKSSAALDFSHVHASKLMEVADEALRMAVAPSRERPKSRVVRFEVKDPQQIQKNCSGMYALFKQSKAMPLVGMEVDETVTRIRGDFQKRDPGIATDEAPFFDSLALFINGEFNLVMPIRPFKVSTPGYYKIRVNGFGVLNDHGELAPSERIETVGLYSNDRTLGFVDLPAYTPTTAELTVWLEPEDTVKPLVASSTFSKTQIPVKTKSGHKVSTENEAFRKFRAHGVAFRWFELEGPLVEKWPPESHRRLFGDLPVEMKRHEPKRLNEERKLYVADVETADPMKDARRLMRPFLVRALRRPVQTEDMKIPMAVINKKLRRNENFMEAMIAGYRTVLTSPDFLLMNGNPGHLNGDAVAERLSYFLWNTAPDGILRNLARQGKLTDSVELRRQVDRLLNHDRSKRFVSHFLDLWLKLEEIDLTEPDANLYPEYNPLLTDSALMESRAYFREMLCHDLGARYVIDSDFVMVNQRLAELYGLTGVSGNNIRRVSLPEDSVRGGFLTQASVLKTTANGTVTSPVVRGDYVLTHLLGNPPPPPPPVVPAVEPDISGTTTIREQLAKHREDPSCAGCHARIDPPGFALESFDVMGAYRDRYRSIKEGKRLGLLVDGRPAPTREALPVDSAGQLEGGEPFENINEFRQLLLQREDTIARHLLEQLIVYSTGAPVGFSDREVVDRIMNEARKKDYGVRSMIHLIVQSPLFLEK